jgi:hypothetical protein
MMGHLKSDQGQLFYNFHLDDAVPEDHLVRKIDAALASQQTGTSLFVDRSPIDRSGTDDPDADRGICQKIDLQGTWKSGRRAYEAKYSGSFERRSAKIKGTQTWTDGGKTVVRTCAGAIKRPLKPFLPRQKRAAEEHGSQPADTVAKVEICNGLNFWRELEAGRDR